MLHRENVSICESSGSHGVECKRDLILFWDVAPWVLRPDDRGSNYIRKVGHFLRDYTAQHPRRQSSEIDM
jgi:hypothetical protein